MGQLAEAQKIRSQRGLPSDIDPNPRQVIVVLLRSGKN